MALAFVMDLLDSTIVNVAIPSIQANLGASYANIQWLVAGYSLTFALLLITGGRMGEELHHTNIVAGNNHIAGLATENHIQDLLNKIDIFTETVSFDFAKRLPY